MKKLFTSFAVILACAFGHAQESFTVKMNMKIDGLPAEWAGFGEQEIVSYTKGDKYKQERTSMMGSDVSSFDGKILTVISEQMGDKSGYTATKEELDAAKDKNKDKEDSKPSIEYTADKKMIAGYECTKAILTYTSKEKKNTDKMTVWVSEKVKAPQPKTKSGGRRGNMGMDFGDLKGTPLEIEIVTKGDGDQEMKILISASEVSTENIPDATFTVSTDGYKMISYKEHQEKMKAMMDQQK